MAAPRAGLTGTDTKTNRDHDVRPFRVHVPQAALDDLHARLRRTRYPRPAPGDSWDYGTPVEHLAGMVAYWRDEFDWRRQEDRMNAYPHHVTEIDGQPVHFVHARSSHPGAIPVVLTHTYPGSFLDFLDMIGPLTDPGSYGE